MFYDYFQMQAILPSYLKFTKKHLKPNQNKKHSMACNNLSDAGGLSLYSMCVLFTTAQKEESTFFRIRCSCDGSMQRLVTSILKTLTIVDTECNISFRCTD